MRDDEEFFTALSTWAHAAEAMVKAEMQAERNPGEKAGEAVDEASEDLEAAADYVMELIREELDKADPQPYRGRFL